MESKATFKPYLQLAVWVIIEKDYKQSSLDCKVNCRKSKKEGKVEKKEKCERKSLAMLLD